MDHQQLAIDHWQLTIEVRSACTPKWQPCVRAQTTLYKKKPLARNEGHELWFETMPGFTRCFLPITELFPAEKKYVHSHPKQKEVGHIACCGVQSKQGRNHLCGGNVLMYAANFQYLILTTADHGKNVNWCTTVSMRACHECRITC